MSIRETEYRVESDFLGLKEVAADAYYGIQTVRAVDNFPVTGYRLHASLIRSMAMVKKAAALANMDTGRLQRELGEAIVQAADEIIGGRWHDQFIVDPIQGGAGTSINMNTNEVIANRALELLHKNKGDYARLSPFTHVNMAQSTNDAFPTAIRLATLTLSEKLLRTMEGMREALLRKADAFGPIIKMGRTHLQEAVPIRLGQTFEAYACVAKRDMERIAHAQRQLCEINLGATAIGTGLNADPGYMKRVVRHLSRISGYSLQTAGHLIDATQNTDAYTEMSGALKVCMINMSKIASDLRLMASGPRAGLSELSLPPRQPGSSIMPGKVNPVIPELVNQVAFQVIGNDLTIGLASEAGQLELNVMEPVLVFNLLQSLGMMDSAFRVFTDYCLKGIEANADKMARDVEQSIGVITAVSPHLGYEAASRIAREALRTGESVRALCLKYNLLTEEELNRILNPFEMTRPGIAGEKREPQ